MKCRAGIAILCLLELLLTGCAKKPPDPVHVQGSVTCDGKPVNGALVTFWPVDSRRRSASALCDQAGKFNLDCVPGAHKVTVTPNLQYAGAPGVENGTSGAARPLPGGTLAIPGQYSATSTTSLQIEVPEGGSNNIALVLTR